MNLSPIKRDILIAVKIYMGCNNIKKAMYEVTKKNIGGYTWSLKPECAICPLSNSVDMPDGEFAHSICSVFKAIEEGIERLNCPLSYGGVNFA